MNATEYRRLQKGELFYKESVNTICPTTGNFHPQISGAKNRTRLHHVGPAGIGKDRV